MIKNPYREGMPIKELHGKQIAKCAACSNIDFLQLMCSITDTRIAHLGACIPWWCPLPDSQDRHLAEMSNG